MLLYSLSTVFLVAIIGVSAAPFPETKDSRGHGPSHRAPTLVDCLTNSSVPISLLSSLNFAQLAEPYNLRLPYTPAVIVLPTTPQHVSDGVKCACSTGVKVQAKSGGHSYASYSSGGKNGSLIVDLESLQNISIDNATGIVKVGGGVRLGNLALGIFNQAQRALPHGTCPGVGIGGHFTHGGYGYDSRMWGLALDTIVGLDVVLANGSFIYTTSTAYPEIYYALRGAADAFGIIINFYLQTQPAPSTVINWSFGIPGMFVSAETSTDAFLHIQDFARNASVIDRKIGFGTYLDGQGFSIGGTYLGTLDDFNNKIAPELLRGLPTPSSKSVQAVDWIKSLTMLAGQSLQQPLTNYNAHDNFFAKSITSPESAPLTREALTSYFNYIIQNGVNPPSPWFSIINLYGGPDSQINNKDINFAAYSDRSSLWVFQHYGYAAQTASPFPSGTTPFIDGLSDALTSAQP
ncbi:glucooligosaccharide oxidase [Lasallia pustulata]|nr:glucooligosaccharide oxidase [Lasallia pustulata]